MILEEETFEAFGYYPRDLSRQSGKLIIAACEVCGKFRIVPKNTYHTFCASCALTGKHLTEETKALISKNSPDHKGEKHPMFGKQHSVATKALMSKSHSDTKGAKNSFYGKHHTEETKLKQSAAKKGAKNPN